MASNRVHETSKTTELSSFNHLVAMKVWSIYGEHELVNLHASLQSKNSKSSIQDLVRAYSALAQKVNDV